MAALPTLSSVGVLLRTAVLPGHSVAGRALHLVQAPLTAFPVAYGTNLQCCAVFYSKDSHVAALPTLSSVGCGLVYTAPLPRPLAVLCRRSGIQGHSVRWRALHPDQAPCAALPIVFGDNLRCGAVFYSRYVHAAALPTLSSVGVWLVRMHTTALFYCHAHATLASPPRLITPGKSFQSKAELCNSPQ